MSRYLGLSRTGAVLFGAVVVLLATLLAALT